MSEKAHFTVDSQGQAEFQPNTPKSSRPVVWKHGAVIGFEGEVYTDPTSPEAVAKGEYYVDRGGRIIDIESGTEVATGDGRHMPLTLPPDYEKQDKGQ
ncbi:MAG TPA: hypothetical protein VMR34_02220 [Candidatus Saccharimonadales bacterium]|nr:hypothetical protein [Candidatus Saccharimonadales bacterium]